MWGILENMKKVLIVEDDPFIRDVTSIKLTEHGYITSVVESGETALTSFEKEIPDVVLLDLDLPDMSGFDVVESMRNDEKLKDVPVIVFSNRDDDEAKEKAAQLGIENYFVKISTNYSELFSKIDAL